MKHEGGMDLEQLLTIVAAVRSVGCRYWLEGGWGIDALVGRQTRAHRDVDLDIDSAFEHHVLTALHGLGYAIETDWRPTRVELAAPGRGWVDVHPLTLDAQGNARQAALAGGWHELPRSFFTMGSIGALAVPCFTAEAQRFFHSGYELRDVDRDDLAALDRLPSP
ncbi:MAG TPA: aminoglycoside adenylyltransferase [Intrasporangium sp.]|uniref:nucleotidyltransferase domain-containing protein n=1 Tax=Intrasporangium sp. TaxID=1925024 RepID=UPI002D76564D|nr:aminoglycoside adenylyltransferase [Intrasporangium sp.]HET7399429.1 aminoglycoside adenylyltransferase [Intrasporangium sp.]